jgi:hypothetical protein
MLPYLTLPKQTFLKVGSPDKGEIYLKSINARTAIERKNLDRLDKIQAESQLALLELAQKISIEESITLDDSLEKILTSNDSELLYKYSKDFERLNRLKNKINKLSDLVAAVMLRERILYPVTLKKAAKNRDEKLFISSLSHPLEMKSFLKFGSVMVQVLSEEGITSESLELSCEPLSGGITLDTVGFVCDASGSPIAGYPDFDRVPDEIFGILSNIGSTQESFVAAVSQLPVEYKDVCFNCLTENGFNDDLLEDIVLSMRTLKLKDLSTDLITEIENFYSRESKGVSEVKNDQ